MHQLVTYCVYLLFSALSLKIYFKKWLKEQEWTRTVKVWAKNQNNELKDALKDTDYAFLNHLFLLSLDKDWTDIR